MAFARIMEAGEQVSRHRQWYWGFDLNGPPTSTQTLGSYQLHAGIITS
jgi:hypothetical protein